MKDATGSVRTPSRANRLAANKALPRAQLTASLPSSAKKQTAVILVAIDFSGQSTKAFRKALEFAKDSGASLVVVHVMDGIFRTGWLDAAAVRGLKKDAQNRCRRALNAFTKREVRHGVHAKMILRTGPAPEQIVAVAEREGAEMIVIGSRGHSGLKRILLGSVAEQVVRRSKCPVLVVR